MDGAEAFDAERYLNSLEPIGWKLGLDRMEMLSTELGRPQDSYATIHVVGTNGKSSVSRMIAAICGAHGYTAGCSLSPHMVRWSERVVVDGREDQALFDSCVKKAAAAAAEVNARLEGEEVTQFELATAAAFLALAEAGVQVAAIEAGLGGRLDATNSIDSIATVLTSIGLDHTEYLGETELEIAGEKLAVLRPGTTLVLGPVSREVRELAARVADEKDCDLLEVGPGRPVEHVGGFQKTNFAVAEAAAGCFLGEVSQLKSEQAVSRLTIHGRLEQTGEDPPLFADVAHNPAGARALADSLPEVTGGGPVIAVIGILADKDAAGMLTELAGTIDTAIFTSLPAEALEAWGRPGAKAMDPMEMAGIAAGLDLSSEVVEAPADAVERARKLALERDGTVLVTGSHFLFAPDGSGFAGS